jgi:hypothetical protein
MILENFLSEIEMLFMLVQNLNLKIESIEIRDNNGNLIIIK